jgi:hypothetical protein
MLKIMAIALAAAMARTVSLLLGIFIIVASKLYFLQIESREFSSGRNSSELDGFSWGRLPESLEFLIHF